MMTFAGRCTLCGGWVDVYDEDTAVCRGYCRLPQTKIEEMTPAQRQRTFKRLQRLIAIEEAATVEVKGDRL